MRDGYQYPQAEHYVFPKSRAEVITDELQYYRTPEQAQELTKFLFEFYEKTPFVASVVKYAFASKVVLGEESGENLPTQGIDEHFAAGAIWGMHTSVKNTSELRRHQIFTLNPLSYLEPTDDNADSLHELVDKMKEWEEVLMDQRFEEHPMELQEAMYDLASVVYCGVHEPYEKERSFVSGYLLACSLIDRHIRCMAAV